MEAPFSHFFFNIKKKLTGNKPDFHNAMPADSSKAFYEAFVKMVRDKYTPGLVKGNSNHTSLIYHKLLIFIFNLFKFFKNI